MVEGRESIGGDDQQPLAQIVDVAHLAASSQRHIGNVCLVDRGHDPHSPGQLLRPPD